jgi:hypothetical protein
VLRSRIIVDLPSVEVLRSKTLGEAFRSLFGAQIDLRTGHEEVTVTGLALVQSLVQGFQRAGITNAIALVVDNRVVYKDPIDQGNDLPLIMAACMQTRLMQRKFGEMHLVVSHAENGMFLIADVRIQREVMMGQAEMVVDVSGRVDDLRVHKGESAYAYAERVRAFARAPQAAEAWRRAFHVIVQRIAGCLGAELPGARIAVEPVRLQLIRPGVKQVGRFRHLQFGANVQRATYRPAPARQRLGAYADPFYYYYYDPYYDFMTFILLDTMARDGRGWDGGMCVVDDAGADLTLGGRRPAHLLLGDLFPRGAIHFTDHGYMEVAQDVPQVEALDVDDLASASDADAWGVDASADDGGGDGGGDGGDGGGDGGSSCGSSCGGCGGGGY